MSDIEFCLLMMEKIFDGVPVEGRFSSRSKVHVVKVRVDTCIELLRKILENRKSSEG